MSQEIQNLIASISEKFDHEFSNTNSPKNKPHEIEARLTAATDAHDEHPNGVLNPELKKEGLHKHHHNDAQSVPEFDQQQNNNQSDQQQEARGSDEEPEYEIEDQLVSHREEGEQISNRRPPSQNSAYEEEEGENKYRDLSHKLETALKKISSSKRGFGYVSELSQSSGPEVLLRFEDYEKRREKQLEIKRRQEQQNKQKKLKDRPTINPKSRQMADQMNQKPIYERFDKIVSDKKKKIQENEEQKKIKEEQEYEQYLEEFRKHQKRGSEGRDSETYFNDMINWKKKLEQKKKQEQEKNEEKAKQGYTYAPVLNPKSVRMLKNQRRVPIQDREVQRPKTEQEEECTFRPKINKRKGI